MSLKAMLEIAKTQNSIESLADALTIALDQSSLASSSDVINPNTVRIVIEHATPEEAVALVNNHLDMASDDQFDLVVCEARDGNGAIVIFNDPEEVVIAELETAGVIMELAERKEKPIPDAEDDEDAPYVPEDDADVDTDDDDEEDAEGDDPNAMKILHDEEGFKLASRLQAMACGPSKTYFPHFLKELDGFLTKMRNLSGYDPSANPEQASVELEDMLEIATLAFIEEAKKSGKKGYKQGRGGFLSAYMRIIAKNSDKLVESWDALDVPGMEAALGDVGAMLCDMMDDQREAQGLEKQGPAFKDGEQVDPEDLEGDEATARVVNK
ncbi:hypothetical protein [Rhizobium phage RHEph12]|nr:hypothetical protein [Rhizobium phage RHEph12]